MRGVAILLLALASDGSVDGLIERLAERAVVHERMLYRFHCVEEMTRRVYRVAGAEKTEVERRARTQRFGLVVTREAVQRQKLRADGTLVRDEDGMPIHTAPSRAFEPIVDTVPQAAVSWFTPDRWSDLEFTVIDGGAPGYKGRCPDGDRVLEFTDVRGPGRTRDGCTAIASGRMCVDPSTGEVSRIQFYPLYEDGDGCSWDRVNPFVTVEQEFLDPANGIRFPSKVETVYPLETSRDRTTIVYEYAIFTQAFTDCVFPEIRVRSGH